MKLLVLFSLLIGSGWNAANAVEPVYVPDISAVSGAETSLAKRLQPLLGARLLAANFIVIDGEHAAEHVGGTIANCSFQFSCPGEPLRLLPSRIALVISLQKRGELVTANVQVFEQSDSVAMDEYTVTVTEGQEEEFFDEVVRGLTEVSGLLSKPSESMLGAAIAVAGQPELGEDVAVAIVPAAPLDLVLFQPEVSVAEPIDFDLQEDSTGGVMGGIVGPVGEDEDVVEVPVVGKFELDLAAIIQVEVPEERGLPVLDEREPLGDESLSSSLPALPVTTPADAAVALATLDRSSMTVEEILEGTGIDIRHVRGAEENLRKSGLDARDWMYRASPHSGRMIVEVRGGVARGDVDRVADLRVTLDSTGQISSWFQETPAVASRIRGGLYFGYAPLAAIDVGVLFGLQYGYRVLSTGWMRQDTAEESISDGILVQAAQGYMQPRVRAYLLQVGPLKPFALLGADFRVIDKYDLNQPEQLTYLSPSAAMYPGMLAGGGLLLDPSPIVGLFAEATYSKYFGYRATTHIEGSWSGAVPTPPDHGSSTAVFTAGLQFRL